MNKLLLTVLAAVALISSAASEALPLDENLEPLRPFLGTWRGQFKRSSAENPMIDVATWERAMNGKAIRVLHSINKGVYGGETLIYWDSGKKEIAYLYVTTAGFQTVGAMKISAGKLEAHERVIGSSGGITEVKATLMVPTGGAFEAKSTFLKGGSWEAGHEISYKSDSGAKVVFK